MIDNPRQADLHRCKVISDENFPVLKDLNTLELGPQDGSAFTQHLLRYTNKVTVVELDSDMLASLRKIYPLVKVVEDDFNECLRDIGQFDAVVVYGILYHSTVPLKVLEDIANYVKPKYILLENILGSNSGNVVTVEKEVPNVNGMRFVRSKSCNLVFSLGQNYYEIAMSNLGYDMIKDFDVAKRDDLVSLPGDVKKRAYYTTWKLREGQKDV